jgi:hypothetical protein
VFKRVLATASVPMIASKTRVSIQSGASKPLSEGALDAMHEKYEAIMHAATADQLPAAWMKRAKSITRDSVDFISIFDGKSGHMNQYASKFGMLGLPPVDVANTTARLDL